MLALRNAFNFQSGQVCFFVIRAAFVIQGLLLKAQSKGDFAQF